MQSNCIRLISGQTSISSIFSHAPFPCLCLNQAFYLKCPFPLSIRQTLVTFQIFNSNVTWSRHHHSTSNPKEISCCVCNVLLQPMLTFSLTMSLIHYNSPFPHLSPQLDSDDRDCVLYTCTSPLIEMTQDSCLMLICWKMPIEHLQSFVSTFWKILENAFVIYWNLFLISTRLPFL